MSTYQTNSYAAINRNDDVRKNSSSGGAFHAIAKYVIEEDGLVFGAAFDENGQVRHASCDNVNTLPELMQSKYVQSAVGNAYKEVADALLKGRTVLFTGTPCQVYGLLSYVDAAGLSSHGQLITADFVCHGVPSRMVWRRYLDQVSNGRKPIAINFRDKTNGWRDFSLKIDFDDGNSYLASWHKDPYVQGFIKNLYLRESCYECQFRGVDRKSDFTIADFWGVHELLPEMYDDRGTSIIMAHNESSVKLLERLQPELQLCEIENEIIVKTNSPVVQSVPMNIKRNSFFDSLPDNQQIDGQIKRFINVPFTKRVVRKIRSILK